MMHDDDQDFYSSDTEDGGAYESDNDSVDSDDNPSLHRLESNFTILSQADIRQRQEDSISKIANILSISKVAAGLLLRNYNWSVSKVHDEWFADEEKVRRAVGLMENFVPLLDLNKLICGICSDKCPRDMMSAAACGHPFCVTCWRSYMESSINAGRECLNLRCPDPSCGAAVGQDMINSLAAEDDRNRYACYFRRSFVDDNSNTKWCPAPGCDYAVFSIVGGSFDVTCGCSYSFCWNCTKEAHRPVDCETVSKWMSKYNAESESMNWILDNCKPCPECKRPIMKDEGCMRMTCTPPCNYEFCWLCLGAWSNDHGERNEGVFICDRYEAAKMDEAELRREMAKNSSDRYTHYYERWTANESFRQKTIADLQQMHTVHLEKISNLQCQPKSELKFIIEAWQQMVECRQVLMWAYVYRYYLPEDEHSSSRQYFEHLQVLAESGLERLRECAEKEVEGYLSEGPSKDFNEFRRKLGGLTSVTKNLFENFVRALEKHKNSGSGSSKGGI